MADKQGPRDSEPWVPPEDPNEMFGTPGSSRPTAPPPETPNQPAEAPGPVSYVPTSFLSTTSYRDDPDRWERHWELVYQQNLAQQGEDSQNRQALDHYLRENPQADRGAILQEFLVRRNVRDAFAAARADAESRGEEWGRVYVGAEELVIEEGYPAWELNSRRRGRPTIPILVRFKPWTPRRPTL